MTSRNTSQDAVEKYGNRYEMVIAASARARELKRGAKPLVHSTSSPIVTALAEIEAGKIDNTYLFKVFGK
ncbi:RpoZ DNA-directed RNA polymerase, subunit K/omega [uncultured Caudovirales phage]|uniref:DNA-directed RNA polymerase n=1 Tax=uncultured Caudovirales phage TaxID=2100421 RepID=A0A6J5L9Q8_9CAUD|nr:RpoZ DNA-directed RNA polymerase, subunit K/omega [uncultured Caudovirales phage]